MSIILMQLHEIVNLIKKTKRFYIIFKSNICYFFLIPVFCAPLKIVSCVYVCTRFGLFTTVRYIKYCHYHYRCEVVHCHYY